MKNFALFLLCCAISHTVFSQEKLASGHQNELVVQLLPGTNPHTIVHGINAQMPKNGQLALVKFLSRRFNFYLMKTANIDRADFPLEKFRQHPAVVSAIWNDPLQFRRDSIPNDPLFAAQWDMQLIQAPAVWSTSTGGTTLGGREIVVAVLDHGFDLDHPDLIENIWTNPNEIPGNLNDDDGSQYPDDIHGWNFGEGGKPFFPITGEDHGTNVAGIIGAKGNNGEGLAGINWNVKLLPVGVDLPSHVVPAMEYVLTLRELYNKTDGQKGAFIVATNGSFGLDVAVPCSSQPVWGALYDSLGLAGILSVAATRNENWDVDTGGDMPTSCPSEFLITVTNTDREDKKVVSAAYGATTIDLSAPGHLVHTTDINARYYDSFQGASSSCPHVAGAVGLLYSLPCDDLDSLAQHAPDAAARLVRDAILNGVDKVTNLGGKTVTGGRLNVYNSLKFLHNFCLSGKHEREDGSFKGRYIEDRGFLNVFPNPASQMISLEYSNYDFTKISVQVYNALGQEVYFYEQNTEPFQNQQINIEIQNWPSGTYFINLKDNGQKLTRKFVKI